MGSIHATDKIMKIITVSRRRELQKMRLGSVTSVHLQMNQTTVKRPSLLI